MHFSRLFSLVNIVFNSCWCSLPVQCPAGLHQTKVGSWSQDGNQARRGENLASNLVEPLWKIGWQWLQVSHCNLLLGAMKCGKLGVVELKAPSVSLVCFSHWARCVQQLPGAFSFQDTVPCSEVGPANAWATRQPMGCQDGTWRGWEQCTLPVYGWVACFCVCFHFRALLAFHLWVNNHIKNKCNTCENDTHK